MRPKVSGRDGVLMAHAWRANRAVRGGSVRRRQHRSALRVGVDRRRAVAPPKVVVVVLLPLLLAAAAAAVAAAVVLRVVVGVWVV